MIGEIREELDETEFLNFIKSRMNVKHIKTFAIDWKKIKK